MQYQTTRMDSEDFVVPRRDSQRSKCYRAERDAFGDEFREVFLDGSIGQIQGYVNSILSTDLCQKLMEGNGAMRSRVLIKRMNSSSGKAWAGADYIKLSYGSESLPVVLHELAHCMTDHYAAHHFNWAQTYLRLVREFMGTRYDHDLRSAFLKHRVKFRRGQATTLVKHKQNGGFSRENSAHTL